MSVNNIIEEIFINPKTPAPIINSPFQSNLWRNLDAYNLGSERWQYYYKMIIRLIITAKSVWIEFPNAWKVGH